MRDAVQLGQFLGQQKGVAPKGHNVRAQSHTHRPSRDERHAEERIDDRRNGEIREPDPVKAARLDGVGEHQQVAVR